MNESSITCMGYPLFCGSLQELSLKKKYIVNTLNQYSYCMAEEDAAFKAALVESDMLLPDGVAIVIASRLLNKQKIIKIAGAQLHDHLLLKLNQEGGSCFYLGSSDATLLKITNRIKSEYPNIRVQSYSPPYKPEFNEHDSEQMVAAVNRFQPDVLFIGMTAPKQEKWVYANKHLLNAKIIGSVGAVFDFYAGTVARPGKLWVSFGMEWLGRLLMEPKRMWKRYLYYGPVFIVKLIGLKSKQVFDFSKVFVLHTKSFKVNYYTINFKHK